MVHLHHKPSLCHSGRVPKRVDHDQRRRQIAEGVWRIAATRGLPAATLREVAAECGVSMRLVQYYFDTKEKLLVAAFEYVAERSGALIRERLAELGRPPTPAEVLRICLLGVLPTDEDSLLLSRVHAAYYAAALTDPSLAAAGAVSPQDLLERVLTDQIRQGQAAGDVPAGLDPTQEARGLAALAAGLASIMLVGGRTPAEATALVDYRLAAIFSAGPRRRRTRGSG